MSRTMKSAIFLALAFAVSWSIAIGGHASGLRESLGPAAPSVLLSAMMCGPAIAALICVIAFEKGRRGEALGLRFKPNLWWLWAWAIPIALALIAVAATILLGGRDYVDIGSGIRQAVEAQGQTIPEASAAMVTTPVIIGMAITLGALINAPILTFTEELGWRGYLYDLWRPGGFWRAALGTGFVWGVWHAPAIYFYGLNYPGQPALGIALFTPFCMLLAVIITHVRERSGSVVAAGIFHGCFNAVGGLTLAAVSNPVFPWNGIVGIGGFIALGLAAAGVALLRRSEPAAAEAAS